MCVCLGWWSAFGGLGWVCLGVCSNAILLAHSPLSPCRCSGRSRCRYCVDWEVQQWSPSDRNKEEYISAFPLCKSVLHLVCGLAQRAVRKGSVLVMDSFFCSVKVFRALRAAGYWAVGTVRKNAGIPKGETWGKCSSRPHGSCRFAVSREGDLLYQQWQDRGVVRLLSTHHLGVGGPPDAVAGMPGVELVRRRLGKGEEFRIVDVVRPPAASDYAAYYDGVDYHDQVSVCYRCCPIFITTTPPLCCQPRRVPPPTHLIAIPRAPSIIIVCVHCGC